MRSLQIQPCARPRLLARARLQTDRISGQTVLLYPEGMIVSSATGVAILRLCDGKHSLAEMLSELAATYRTTIEHLEPDVSAYLQSMYQQGVLEVITPEVMDE